MRSDSQLLTRLTKLCFAATIATLVAIAALTSAAYYVSALGYWSLIEPVGFVMLAGAAAMCTTFLAGFCAHTANVLLFSRKPPPRVLPREVQATDPSPAMER